jgi:hypothetical protein
MISSATQKDWDSFWKSESVVNSYSEYNDDASFEDIWWEMESIEPLTPVTKIKRES